MGFRDKIRLFRLKHHNLVCFGVHSLLLHALGFGRKKNKDTNVHIKRKRAAITIKMSEKIGKACFNDILGGRGVG